MISSPLWGTPKTCYSNPSMRMRFTKLLLLIDQLREYCWVGGLACSVRSDTQILKEVEPQLKDLRKGEVILLDGSFPPKKHGIFP